MRQAPRLMRQRGLSGRCLGLASAVFVLVAAGCSSTAQSLSEVQPDLAAIVKVVNDAYRAQGFDRPVLFLDMGEVCDSILPKCVPSDGGIFPALKKQLETDLHVEVWSLSEADFTVPSLTPVLPETGDVGVSVSLGRFREEDDGYPRHISCLPRYPQRDAHCLSFRFQIGTEKLPPAVQAGTPANATAFSAGPNRPIGRAKIGGRAQGLYARDGIRSNRRFAPTPVSRRVGFGHGLAGDEQLGLGEVIGISLEAEHGGISCGGPCLLQGVAGAIRVAELPVGHGGECPR